MIVAAMVLHNLQANLSDNVSGGLDLFACESDIDVFVKIAEDLDEQTDGRRMPDEMALSLFTSCVV